MSVKLDTLDLQYMISNQDRDGFGQLGSLWKLDIIDRRRLVELDIPGSSGNTLQDMGRGSIRISLVGEFMGKEAKKTLEQLWAKYDANQPFDFSSDLTTSVAEVSKVLIEKLYVEEVASDVKRYRYRMTLKEYREPKPQEQQKTPEQEAKVTGVHDIEGIITDFLDRPAKSCPLIIKSDEKTYTAKTNDKGAYWVDDVDDGSYVITVDDTQPDWKDFTMPPKKVIVKKR